MTAESSSRLKSPDSFGETAATACDGTRAGKVRTRWAVALLVAGLLVAFVPALTAGDAFLKVLRFWVRDASGRAIPDQWLDPMHFKTPPVKGTSAFALVRTKLAWAAVAVSLAIVPLLFAAWRRAGFGGWRIAGIACSLAASTSVVAIVASLRGSSELPGGAWWTAPAGGALMAAAFVVAPAPRRRDE